jgi:DNA primase
MAGKLAQEVKKNKITLYELMADHAVKWEEVNEEYARASCPFCTPEDRKHYLSVSRKKDIFYCANCRVGGDRIEYIKQIKNCTFQEACHYLADKYVDTHVY